MDYIFLSRRQQEWAQIWEAFILEHDVRVNGAEGYESDDDDYSKEGDVPVVFRGAGTTASATGDDDFVLHGKQKRSNTKGDRRKPKKQRGISTKKKKRVITK